jgi:DNA-binding CsgD family transcriptional regulator
MWKGLVAGTWSLVERFESDGRRYLVAKRNAPDLGRRLRLSEGEARVVKLSALGHSQKYVAYALGLSQPMVSAHLASAMLKLRVRSRAELLTLCGVLFDA